MSFPEHFYHVQIAGIGLDLGDFWQIGHYYRLSPDNDGHDAFEIATALATQYGVLPLQALTPCLASNVRVDTVAARKVGGAGGPTSTVAVTVPGERTPCETIGNGAQLCWLGVNDAVNFMVENRTYFPGIPNDSFDAGVWDADYLEFVNTYIEAMLAPLDLLGTITAHFFCVSFQGLVESQEAVYGMLRQIPGTQRRRLRR